MSARPGGAAGLAPAARSVGLAGLAETPKIKPGFGGVDCVAVKKTKHRIAEKVNSPFAQIFALLTVRQDVKFRD